MLHRHAPSCQALRRPLMPTTESIWVSDSLLLATYERFVAHTRGSKRHGSFVPGPLESRRRLGRRRMVYVAGAAPHQTQRSGNLWGWFQEVDVMQWQWEAPTTRCQSRRQPKPLTSWLLDWLGTHAQETDPSLLDVWPQDKVQQANFHWDEIPNFQRSLQDSSPEEIVEICSQFNKRLKQNITIGVVPTGQLHEALLLVSSTIEVACTNTQLAKSYLLQFYQAVWEGLLACRVTRISSLPGSLLNQLLTHIVKLQMVPEVKHLVESVISNVSTIQLEYMEESIIGMIKGWSADWSNREPFGDYKLRVASADHSVKTLGLSIQQIQRLVEGGQVLLSASETMQATLRCIKSELLQAIELVRIADIALMPSIASTSALADCLRKLSGDVLVRIIDKFSFELSAACRLRPTDRTRNWSLWMSVVAQLPEVDLEMFIATWKKMGEEGVYLTNNSGSEVILLHMFSQGFIKEPSILRNTFEAVAPAPSWKHYGHILVALNKQREPWSRGASYLFRLLSRVNRHRSIFKSLSITKLHGVKPPVKCVRDALELLAPFDAGIAYKLYRMHIPASYSIRMLQLSRCPNFVMSLIHHKPINPSTIWETLGILPISDKRIRRIRKPRMGSLSPRRIGLITQMATEFARSKAITTRVALRNVTRCLSYLRQHDVPISVEISKAISYVSITRGAVDQTLVGVERLRWALKWIGHCEGKEIQDDVDTLMWHWRQEMMHNGRKGRSRNARRFSASDGPRKEDLLINSP